MTSPVRVGIIGSHFIAGIHAESFSRIPNCEVVAVASPTKERVEAFAAAHGIPRSYTDCREMLALAELDVVSLALPNDLHLEATLEAAASGKHVICEKPIARTLDEADQMIAACTSARVQLFYAEELLFAPKYVRAKQLGDDGALGEVFLVKQS